MSESPISGKIEVKAEVDKRSVDKLIDAVVDTFSPATELLGALGDSVRLARVEMAAHVTRRAKEIADCNGLELSAPPLKFLVPFYEKASLESDADDGIVDAWANLLASTGSGNGVEPRFVQILSELTPSQAQLLKDCYWGRSERPSRLKSKAIIALVDSAPNGLRDRINPSYWPNFWEELTDAGAKFEECAYALLEVLNRRGFCSLLVSFTTKIGTLSPRSVPESLGEPDMDQSVLLSIGLFERHEAAFDVEGLKSHIPYVQLSDLGIRFLCACDLEIARDFSVQVNRKNASKADI